MEIVGLRKWCSRDPQALGRLLEPTRSTAFTSEVSAIHSDPDIAPADDEQVWVQLPNSLFGVAIDREPAAVAEFLREAHAIFRRAFGSLMSRYDISLVPSP